mmetsp:Transcript_32625/g.74919  ORF Transcript_32625/g.74919 Transcript_32625/m.74919 type:complete len:309 (+) Transcript_32625:717-1643(+)
MRIGESREEVPDVLGGEGGVELEGGCSGADIIDLRVGPCLMHVPRGEDEALPGADVELVLGGPLLLLVHSGVEGLKAVKNGPQLREHHQPPLLSPRELGADRHFVVGVGVGHSPPVGQGEPHFEGIPSLEPVHMRPIQEIGGLPVLLNRPFDGQGLLILHVPHVGPADPPPRGHVVGPALGRAGGRIPSGVPQGGPSSARILGLHLPGGPLLREILTHEPHHRVVLHAVIHHKRLPPPHQLHELVIGDIGEPGNLRFWLKFRGWGRLEALQRLEELLRGDLGKRVDPRHGGGKQGKRAPHGEGPSNDT